MRVKERERVREEEKGKRRRGEVREEGGGKR